MKPLIGVTSNVSLPKDPARGDATLTLKFQYMKAFAEAGAAPIILPAATDAIAGEILARLDGLVLSGGQDIPPERYGAQPHPSCTYMPPIRWESEALWLRTARKLHVPVLGICLGMQVINVVSGGSLIQDIPSMRLGSLPHAGPDPGVEHSVAIEPGSRLAAMAHAAEKTVMSSHHQAVDRLAEGFRVTAKSSDGLFEAMESTGKDFLLGVQWHPERCVDQPNWLLQGFVDVCALNACSAGRHGEGGLAPSRACPVSDVLRKVLET